MKIDVRASVNMPDNGLHLAKIDSVDETLSKVRKTPQLAVVYVPKDPKEKWRITKWYQLRGYQHNEDGSIKEVDNLPVESKENTEICFEILGRDAYRMGLEEGTIDATALIGNVCGIQVEPKDDDPSKSEVSKVISLEMFEEISA